MIEFCVPKDELEKALAALKQAEANGFLHCMPVFRMLPGGRGLDEWVAAYDDLVVRTAPDDLNADYGRARGMTVEQRFEGGVFVDNEVLEQRCSACGDRQIMTPSGITCLQGHAGVVAAPPMDTCEHQFEGGRRLRALRPMLFYSRAPSGDR